jgi:hypothetical protein
MKPSCRPHETGGGRPGGHIVDATPASIVHELITEAVRLGADTIRVEYRSGYEEISVLKGGVGFGIARWPSSGRRAVSLRKELVGLRKKTKTSVSGAEYEVRTHTYDHFGEEAFEVRLRRI